MWSKRKESGAVRRRNESRQPKEFENVKSAMFIKGHKTSQIINDTLNDFYTTKKPNGVKFNKKKSNSVNPMEDPTAVEFFSNSKDASLFMYGCHSKKRPHNLVVGRLFNHRMLDMVEFGIEDFKSTKQFSPSKRPMHSSKPCFTVIGSEFQSNDLYKLSANLFIDFFRGTVANGFNLKGIDQVISLSVGPRPDTILWKQYFVHLKKSGSHIPRAELEEIGPSMTLVIRREFLAAPGLKSRSLEQSKLMNFKRKKNVFTTGMGDTMANIHVPRQNMNQVMKGVTKPKALRTHGRKRNRENDHQQHDDYSGSTGSGGSSKSYGGKSNKKSATDQTTNKEKEKIKNVILNTNVMPQIGN